MKAINKGLIMIASDMPKPAVWFPAIRAGSGTDVFTERLAEGLRRRGLHAQITWLPHRAEYAPWTVASLRPPAWANIAHVNTWLPRRFIPTELPLVATMHHCVHDPALGPHKSHAQKLYHRLWVRIIERGILIRAHQVIAVSRYTAQRTKATYRISGIKVIHNGIDLDGVFHPATGTKPHHPFRLLYVGKWSCRKGSDLIGPIMAILGPNFELRYTANRSHNGQSMDIPPNCHSLGRLKTPKALAYAYQNADALLFPTRLEGFGLVALEAQACGLPVIATRGSALPEVISDCKTGLLCPQDDVAAFVGAARKLASDHALLRLMSKAARISVEAQFGIETMIDHYLSVYRNILARLSHDKGAFGP